MSMRTTHDPALDLAALSDEALFEACRPGDERPFRVLVDRHAGVVRRLALNILGDAHEAEDVAQEAFVAAWRAREGWTPEARFTTWLHRITVNKAIDRYRARRATPEPHEAITRLAEAAPAAEVENQHQALERRERALSLRNGLARLPDSQRRALTMFYFEDQDVARIARALDTTEQAVRSLLKRGKQSLRTLIQRQKSLRDHGSFRIPATPLNVRA
jgi:RNA polymerase sigma-70 factor, ECF subfamily